MDNMKRLIEVLTNKKYSSVTVFLQKGNLTIDNIYTNEDGELLLLIEGLTYVLSKENILYEDFIGIYYCDYYNIDKKENGTLKIVL